MLELEKIKTAVNSIEMSETMKKRVKQNCKKVEKRRRTPLNIKRWIPVGAAFGILLLVMISMPLLNLSENSKGAKFTITAYANSTNGNPLHTNLSTNKANLELLPVERMGVIRSSSGEDQSNNLIYTNVMLKISGENIDSITYTINKGKFIEDVTLTAQEVQNLERLLSEKIYSFSGHPDSTIFQGIKEIGSTFTVPYNEQNQNHYSLALPYTDNPIKDDIIINVVANYKDGKSEQQDIVVNQDAGYISFLLK